MSHGSSPPSNLMSVLISVAGLSHHIPVKISSGVFTLVDSAGYTTQEGELGLLLYNGGTVCDNDFSFNSANAICHLMG